MDKMQIYDAVRTVPPEAQRTIGAGRLKGKTDINPMWRIAVLTEMFGPCGMGWKYVIKREWTEAGANGEIAAFVDIDLYYRDGDKWSEAIPGTGGSAFVAREKSGLYTSDECYKMALTDAISVACKALGVGADVYWAAGRTKYTAQDTAIHCESCGAEIGDTVDENGKRISAVRWSAGTQSTFGQVLCPACVQRLKSIDAVKSYAD